MSELLIKLGRHPDGGEMTTLDLVKAPHVIVAGMTGSGKSALIHNIICQLIEHKDSEVGLVLIDPKRVELSRYAGLPHVIHKPVHDVVVAKSFLEWTVGEMNIRFEGMEAGGFRDIDEWNEHSDKTWSRLVVVIDELANLILADNTIERPIVNIASMGRAAGIHLILATQRPSADVVTGLIRANVPTRLCLPVVTAMESRIILDAPGAESLQNPGEILARLPWSGRALVRVDSEYIPDSTIEQLIGLAMLTGMDDDAP